MTPTQSQLREELRQIETQLTVFLRGVRLMQGADDRKWVSVSLDQHRAGFRSARMAIDQMEENRERGRMAA